MPPLSPTSVVTVFITKSFKVLLLRRSELVGSYRGLWAGVSGYLESDDPLAQAWVELEEELGIGKDNATLQAVGGPIRVSDEVNNRAWIVHPFRFSLAKDFEPQLDWEHVELKWVLPEEINNMNTVPDLWKAWCSVSVDLE